jgi:site-specific recombinase XerD
MATALEIYEDFILSKELQGVSANTIERYKYSIERMIREVEITDIRDITAGDIRRWLMGRGVKPVSVGIDIKNLRTFFTWVVAEGHLNESPMDKIPNPKIPQIPPKALEENEIYRLMEAAKRSPRDTAVVLVLIDCGLRASELGSLTRDDLALDDMSLTVRHGKGGKARTVYISETTIRALRRYLRTRQDADPALFLSRQGQPLNRDSLRLLTYRLSDRAGLNNGRRVSPHCLRATFATQYCLAGGDAHSLQRLMGHSSTRMAERYVNLVGKDVAAAHRRYSPVSRLERQRRG